MILFDDTTLSKKLLLLSSYFSCFSLVIFILSFYSVGYIDIIFLIQLMFSLLCLSMIFN